jgi:hypothetical protein
MATTTKSTRKLSDEALTMFTLWARSNPTAAKDALTARSVLEAYATAFPVVATPRKARSPLAAAK